MKGKHHIILLTNDDGIKSEGLNALYDSLSGLGVIYIVAPDREMSAASHAVTLHRPLRIERLKKRVFAVDGTPTDCVNLAINGLLRRKPDLIISGINMGENLGDDITYSGTVSAAMEGTILGIPSIAISISGRKEFRFNIFKDIIFKIVQFVLKKGLPENTFLNVNIPNVDRASDIKGIRFTRQGKRRYGYPILKRKDPRGKWYYWIGGNNLDNQIIIDNSDISAVMEGYISITPIHLDLTNYEYLKKLKNWKIF